MNIKKILISGVLIWIINTIIRFITCGWLFSWVYKLQPTNIWVDQETMMSGTTMLWANLFSLVAAMIFATAFG